jgi:hypothetical protein
MTNQPRSPTSNPGRNLLVDSADLLDLRSAQVETLRQIGENLAAQTRRLEGLTAKVDDVRERLVRLEAQEAGKLVDAVRADLKAGLVRIDDLEAQRDKVAGAAAFWAWCARSAPWLAAGATAFLAGLGLKAGSR